MLYVFRGTFLPKSRSVMLSPDYELDLQNFKKIIHAQAALQNLEGRPRHGYVSKAPSNVRHRSRTTDLESSYSPSINPQRKMVLSQIFR